MSWGRSWGTSWLYAWGATRIEEFAKSGYWRLFYYKLQEAALKDKQKRTVVTEKPAVRAAQVYLDSFNKKKQKTPAIEVKEPVKTKLCTQKLTVVAPEHVRNTIWLYSYLAEFYFTFSPQRSTIVTPGVPRKTLSSAHLLLLLSEV